MAYSEDLASRVRSLLAAQAELREQKMFGGLTFMVGGHMCCGVVGDELMVRVGPAQYGAALDQPHARMIDFTGRPMAGMVMVAAAGLVVDADLVAWVARGLAFVSTLSPKERR
jgi:TfoX/Sxy family transcriptional regulator of competence genes